MQHRTAKWCGVVVAAILALSALNSCGQGTTNGGGISYGSEVINAPTPRNDATAHATILPVR